MLNEKKVSNERIHQRNRSLVMYDVKFSARSFNLDLVFNT